MFVRVQGSENDFQGSFRAALLLDLQFFVLSNNVLEGLSCFCMQYFS